MAKELYPPFIVIPMSYNSEGEGPEMDPSKVAKTVYEVWDSACQTAEVRDTEDEALVACLKLNQLARDKEL